MRNRAVLAYVGMLAISFAGVFAWISGSSFVLQDIYGLSALQFGLAFAAASGGYLAGTALAARFVVRVGLDRTIGIGALALAARWSCGRRGYSTRRRVGGSARRRDGALHGRHGTAAAADHRRRHDAVSASRRYGIVAGRRRADGLRGDRGVIVGHLLGTSAWPVAVPLAISGVVTLLLWAISRGVRAREGAAHPQH